MNSSLWRIFEDQIVDGKYTLQRLLGVGSYGGVFLADEVVADRLIRQVAVKLMETDPKSQDAQMQELIAAANLDHPALLRSFTCGLCELNRIPLLYLITELAEATLEEPIQTAPLSEAETREVARCIASGLAYLHGQSSPLVHRDVKPGNVMRVNGHWKLGDFGLLRAVDRQNPMQTGTMVGTAAYAPPESYRGAVTPAWDLWSLGALLVEALTGRLPFDGDTPHRLMIAVSSQEPHLPADLPSPFDRIIRGCLARDPAARWTAAQVLDALADTSSKTSAAPPVSSLSDAFYARLGAVTPPQPEADDAPLIVSSSGSGHYRSLSEAVRSAPPNRRIRVQPGVYTEQVVLDRPVEIEGEGDRVSIVLETRGMPCLVMRTDSARVRGLTLMSRADLSQARQGSFKKHPAVEIGQGALILEDCDIACTSTVCVAIHGKGTRPLLRGCHIHDGKTGGVLVSDQAEGTLENCDIYGNGGDGIQIRAGAAPGLQRCVIYSNREAGVSVEEAGGTLEDCDLYSNAGPGLQIGAGGDPTLRNCRLFDGAQAGVSARDGGQGTLEACDIHSHVLSNVLITQGARPLLRRCRIHDGHSNGVWVSQNGQGIIEECEIFGNTFAGLKVSHAGNPLLRRTTLRDGKRAGILLQDRGRATLIDCDIAANAQAGVQVETGANLTLRHCIARDGKESGVWLAGDGLLEDCDIFGNLKAGVEIRQGGRPTLRGCKIHDGPFVGVLAQGSAQAILEDCDIYANALPGVAIGEESRVDVRSCRIFDGKQVGLVFWERGRGVVQECDIYANALGGVRIRQGSDPLLRNCRINQNGSHGVHISERSEGAVMQCDLTQNQGESLFIEAGCATQTADNTL